MTLRVAVIGMGPIGNLHAGIYREEPLVQLAGVCDRDAGRAAEAGKRHAAPSFTDAAKMLEELSPDLVSIATGGFEYCRDHYEPTLQALAAGCHVLCEKPICDDLVKAREMVETANSANRCFGLDFNHRFTPAALAAKAWFDAGEIGSVLFCNMALWIGKFGSFETPNYHLKALNPHSVNLMTWFCGPIESVQCFAIAAPGRDIWSTASINVQFASGAVGHLTSSYDIARAHTVEMCEVAGVNGRLVVDDIWREATLYPASTMEKRVYANPIFGGVRDFDDTFRARIHRFVEQVSAGAIPAEIDGSGADGLEAQRVIHAAIRSLDEANRCVTVAEV